MANDSDPRVFFAAERTLLAWIRTGLTIIALGFVVATAAAATTGALALSLPFLLLYAAGFLGVGMFLQRSSR